MNPRRKSRLYLVFALILGSVATVALVLYALRSNIDLFYTPSELLEGKGVNHDMPHVGQRLRIGGMVQAGSLKRDSGSLKITFNVYDARGVVAVTYDGILPDLFREEQGIVAQGVLEEGNVIRATEVLAKHDENYTPPEVAEAMKSNHSPATQSMIKTPAGE